MSVIEKERLPGAVPFAEPTNPPREVTRADVLERAADLLEEFGWLQGTLGSKEEGGFCLLGSVFTAHRDLTGEDPGTILPYPEVGSSIWNDQPGRTKEEVIVRLRGAAARLRGE
jgi:hypothetical protein